MSRESFKQESRIPIVFYGTVTEARKASCSFQNNDMHKKPIYTLAACEA